MDIYRRGGDSLMGRYLLYRMHPWSVGECIRTELPAKEIHPPKEVERADWDALWEHGGFPEPFLRREARFTRRWRSLRQAQLSREDLRDVASVRDLGTMETLMELLVERSAQQLVYSNLVAEIQVSVDTMRRWIDLLTRMHYSFTVRPWFNSVAKALRKEPKWFLRDWSGVTDDGRGLRISSRAISSRRSKPGLIWASATSNCAICGISRGEKWIFWWCATISRGFWSKSSSTKRRFCLHLPTFKRKSRRRMHHRLS